TGGKGLGRSHRRCARRLGLPLPFAVSHARRHVPRRVGARSGYADEPRAPSRRGAVMSKLLLFLVAVATLSAQHNHDAVPTAANDPSAIAAAAEEARREM